MRGDNSVQMSKFQHTESQHCNGSSSNHKPTFGIDCGSCTPSDTRTEAGAQRLKATRARRRRQNL